MGKYVDFFGSKEHREEYRENEKRDYLRKEKLTTKVVERGIILPAKGSPKVSWALGGVLDENGNFMKESCTRNESVFGGAYDYDKSQLIQSQDTVIFMGPFLCHWGHFICDQISRLWYILSDVKEYKIAYCGWNWGNSQTALWGNFLEFFKLLGVSEEQLINVTVPMQFVKVIIPEFSFVQGNYYTNEFKNIFRTIVNNVNITGREAYDYIYFTRRNFSDAQKKERGEEELEEIFRENGYKILVPEQLSLSEQIFYLTNCKLMAAISGSITHNFLFAKENQKFIVLNKMELMNGYQMVIDSIMDIDIIGIDVYKKLFPVCFGLGPFLVGVNKNFKAFMKKYHYEYPSKKGFRKLGTIKNYLWYLKRYLIVYLQPHNRSELVSQQHAVKEQRKAKLKARKENN